MFYIQCARRNGLVLGYEPYDQSSLIASFRCFWVEVDPAATDGQLWQPTCSEDQVTFQSNQPLPEPTADKPLIIRQNQGQWLHSIDQQQLAKLELLRRRQAKNQAIAQAIKNWCLTQVEGMEEAFINYGIEDIEHPRYLAYREAIAEIKAEYQEDDGH
ncbi:hypothetical protein [Spartinivicinus poritis]|uniref:Uncharacterized protein n=1 Tax=Spartinivicinus poritis TaxID=2994640 RepID=A0ABT5U6W6_9GAMM|nr:hypothetical protein [Spartinivicinus sp. A2-2]MDE1462123.1 hypothetical protein [Spartinivicinus sp. A2-2]